VKFIGPWSAWYKRPIGPPARHDLCNGDRAVPGLRLGPDGLTRHDPFLIHAGSGHVSTGTSPARLRAGRPGTAHWPGIVTNVPSCPF
jgi:hypothetical protein